MFGFRWQNIFGGDLSSTNPKILELNMEDMSNIQNGSFHVVTMVNTLGYTSEHEKVFTEVARILAPGGRFVFNNAFSTLKERKKASYTGDTLPDQRDISEMLIFELLEKVGLKVYFHFKPGLKTKPDGDILYPTWFGLQKPAH